MRYRLRLLHPVRDRRVISAVLLVVAALSGIVFSLPQVVSKDRSVPFPCMDRACSCRDAQACWESCCCFSDQEKLAWAAERQVTPPGEVSDRAALQGAIATAGGATCAAPRSCCDAAAGSDPVAPAVEESCPAEPAETLVVTLPRIGERRCEGIDRLYVIFSMACPLELRPLTCSLQPPLRLGKVHSDRLETFGRSALLRPPQQRDLLTLFRRC